MAETTSSENGPGNVADPKLTEPPPEEHSLGFPVVGIGASAGGVAAFEAFFSTMPADTDPGMAFVVVQHLARDHKSILSELIRRYTRMQVFEVEDGMVIEPNCAYIIPPNRDMTLVNGRLQLFEPTLARGIRLPIDFFFRSLAQDQRERAICIVLSGTGSDGALGVRAVKGEGGMVMAQTPESTEYDGMPRSAIATGMVDFVLTPSEMPAQLLAYTAHAFGRSLLPATTPAQRPVDGLNKIFHLLRSQTGHDFSQYKQSTIQRRVARRMAVHQIDRPDDYLRYLQLTPNEVGSLFRDLLINVTNFFRDSDVFDKLREHVLPRMFAGKQPGAAIRIWVPGCSTGEEAYSLAMLIRECMDDRKENCKVQIFATDLDREAIDQARAGVYPSSIVADVSAERLSHFFEEERPDGPSYRIHKTIRDMLIFSEHNLIKDPPFSKLDLISCRNLLIYLSSDLQKRLIPLFHYALKPGGILVLGSSESVGDSAGLFDAVDRTVKIYQRKPDAAGHDRPVLPSLFPRLRGTDVERPSRAGALGEPKIPLHEIVERTLMQHYSPVGALVNERGDILYLVGRTGQYLEPSPGEASMNLFRMAREGLRSDLTVVLHRAVSQGITARQSVLRVTTEVDSSTIQLTVIPVSADVGGAIPPGLFLVLINEEVAAAPKVSGEASVDAAEDAAGNSPDLNEYLITLKHELRAKDEHLQTAIEELETSNEELRSAHEEMQSVNEEMQSTNEELETSKEELQSVNEELATVNSELHAKVMDLSRSNNDMKNLLSGTGIGTIFVDHLLRILRFTPAVSSLVNLIETDVGRPLDQIRSNLAGYDRLSGDIQEVLTTLIPKELELQNKSGQWYLVSIRPYRTLDNVIEGAVITFTDCTDMKLAQAALRDSEAQRRLAVVLRDTRDAVLVQDMSGRILAWNPGAERMYGWTEAEALEMNVLDMSSKSARDKTSAAALLQSDSGDLTPRRFERLAKDGRTVHVSAIVSALVNNAGETYAIATTERPVADPPA